MKKFHFRSFKLSSIGTNLSNTSNDWAGTNIISSLRQSIYRWATLAAEQNIIEEV